MHLHYSIAEWDSLHFDHRHIYLTGLAQHLGADRDAHRAADSSPVNTLFDAPLATADDLSALGIPTRTEAT